MKTAPLAPVLPTSVVAVKPEKEEVAPEPEKPKEKSLAIAQTKAPADTNCMMMQLGTS